MAAWLTSKPIAHRGLHDAASGIPENSLASFEAACVAGYGIELDVQMTKDGLLAVFHDTDLSRLTDGSGVFDDLTMAELQALKLGNSGEHIPSLKEALDLVAGRAPLLVEIKKRVFQLVEIEQALAGALASYKGEFAVSSFNPFALAHFARFSPGAIRGQNFYHDPLRDHRQPWRLRKYLQQIISNFLSRPDFVVFNHHALPLAASKRCRQRGLAVLTFTVKTEAEWKAVKAYADNIIFEDIRP